MTVKLSAPMMTTLEWIRAHGGFIHRFPGGFWGDEKYKYHKTVVVEALVRRGLLEYTEYKDGRNGRFPVEAKLK